MAAVPVASSGAVMQRGSAAVTDRAVASTIGPPGCSSTARTMSKTGRGRPIRDRASPRRRCWTSASSVTASAPPLAPAACPRAPPTPTGAPPALAGVVVVQAVLCRSDGALRLVTAATKLICPHQLHRPVRGAKVGTALPPAQRPVGHPQPRRHVGQAPLTEPARRHREPNFPRCRRPEDRARPQRRVSENGTHCHAKGRAPRTRGIVHPTASVTRRRCGLLVSHSSTVTSSAGLSPPATGIGRRAVAPPYVRSCLVPCGARLPHL